MSVREELEELAELKQKPGSDDREYKEKLTRKVDKIVGDNQEAWESLSVEAQAWINDSIEAIEAKQPLPEFPGEKKEKKLIKKTAAAPSPSEPEEAPTKKERAVRTPAPEGKPSALKRTWMIMIENPATTLDEVMDQLGEEGYEGVNRGTVSGKRADVLFMLKIIKDMGKKIK